MTSATLVFTECHESPTTLQSGILHEKSAAGLPLEALYNTLPPTLVRVFRCDRQADPARIVALPMGFQPNTAPGYRVQPGRADDRVKWDQLLLVGRPAAALLLYGGASEALFGKLGQPSHDPGVAGSMHYVVPAAVRNAALAAVRKYRGGDADELARKVRAAQTHVDPVRAC